MQIFLRVAEKLKTVDVSDSCTFENLNCTIKSLAGYNFCLNHPSSNLVSSVYSENSIINVPALIVGGGKDILEEDKLLAMKHMAKLICRRCYGRNGLKAKRCRKRSCGNPGDLRPKRMPVKK